ncbi:CheR family methyltransferase [Desulfopila aestuarii]|uniref:Two-component system, chemotaxis family, CheB/CheR fusion protein n=1 Tax=Desulfopila aestuarii DSM 18488 TaxID=1121416 RepID=A0A1M7Y5H0_9BACT|nr:CheR family methyltransferase [Desulfopila aestuarii]SHO47739.1 two-component system, chemotaxis family, CheB/CheR fusion protein [Desulfopila aestuarii DSM 18488]
MSKIYLWPQCKASRSGHFARGSITNDCLTLSGLDEKTLAQNLIDTFLSSLANDRAEQAIGIILSGTGSDGTRGVRNLKSRGSLILVQEPSTAKYESMPQSAVDTGLVDYILPPEKMPLQIVRYVNNGRNVLISGHQKDMEHADEIVIRIIEILRSAIDHDFSRYKKNTIIRRIERRMAVLGLTSSEQYMSVLENSKHETSILFKELLIGVTSFFRDSEAYAILKDKYLPELLREREQDKSIRVWIPACSTGEEAYSVAIMLSECVKQLDKHYDIQIFATDLDARAIETARAGLYPESISGHVSPERLNAFFDKKDNAYQVKKSLREMITFAQQNIIKDPPFTKIDILCCRNLLIYFSSELQKQLIPLFHYSLNKSGILFIGTSETIGIFHDLFSSLDKKYKIFKKIDAAPFPHPLLQFPNSNPVPRMRDKKISKSSQPLKNTSTAKMLKMILAQSDITSCVITDDAAEIQFIHGRTSQYLELAEGKASMNLLKMARHDIRQGLAKAYHTAKGEGHECRTEVLCRQADNIREQVNIVVRPLTDSEFGKGLMLVIFETVVIESAKDNGEIPALPQVNSNSDEAKRLKEKLRITQKNLKTTIEELELSNEELKSTNEELQSTNEELQSSNEELETSKEELQSLNEESVTVNTELQKRIEELVTANDDIQHLLESTSVASIFLDNQFNIRRFTTSVRNIFPLTDSDVGRPIAHFACSLENANILSHAKSVQKSLQTKTIHLPDQKGNIYRMRLRPFRTVNNVIDGIVITFEDITELNHLKEKSSRLKENTNRLAVVVKDAYDAVTLQDPDGNILAWNNAAEQLYGIAEQNALKMNIRQVIPQHLHGNTHELYRKLQHEDVRALPVERIGNNGQHILVALTVTRLLDQHGKVQYLATTEKCLKTLST